MNKIAQQIIHADAMQRWSVFVKVIGGAA